MSGVMIGVDPHTASATIEVRDEREVLLATGRFGADTGGLSGDAAVLAAMAPPDVGGGGLQRHGLTEPAA